MYLNDLYDLLAAGSLVVGGFSVALAIVSIWLSLHHKSRTDDLNDKVMDLLRQVSVDAETLRTYSFEQLTRVTNRVMDEAFVANRSGIKEETSLVDATNQPKERFQQPDSLDQHRSTLDEFDAVVARIADGDGFLGTDRDAAVGLIRQIKGTSVEQSSEFAILLERLLDSFASADQHTYIDVIDDWLPTVTASHTGINTTMLQHLGFRLIGAASPNDRDISRFKKHMAQANDNEHIALVMWLVFSFCRGNTVEVDNGFDRLSACDALQKLEAVSLFDRLIDESNIAKTPTESIRAIAANFRRFCEENSGRLEELRGNV